jgi:hypothetical protein
MEQPPVVADAIHAHIPKQTKIRIKQFHRHATFLHQRIQEVLRNDSEKQGKMDLKRNADVCTDELRPKDELVSLGDSNFRESSSSTILSKTDVTQKMEHALDQFRCRQAMERKEAGRALRCVRHCLERDPEEKTPGEKDKDFFKRRRTWLEQQAIEVKKQAKELAKKNEHGMGRASERVPDDELVFKVHVYLPLSVSYVSEEFFVLGSTNLTELRDKIYCVMDVNMGNVDTYQQAVGQTRVSDDRAYIVTGKNRFYEDRRHRGDKEPTLKNTAITNIKHKEDLSRPVVEHLRREGQQCSVLSMEQIRFCDLADISFDKDDPPMMYCHQACCEHIVKIVDVRLFNPRLDPAWKQQYPFRYYAPGYVMEHRRACEVCQNSSANMVTYGDRNTSHSPWYWCEQCFNKMHIQKDGTLLYDDFTCFPYEHGYMHTLGL